MVWVNLLFSGFFAKNYLLLILGPQFCEMESSSKGLEREREGLSRYDSTRSLIYTSLVLLRAISCLACYAHA